MFYGQRVRLKGLRLDRDESFSELFAPIMPRLAVLFWWLDCQSGPFVITDKADFEDLEIELDGYHTPLAALDRSSSTFWKPGIFPRFADVLYQDEWSYLVGFRGPESRASAGAVSASESAVLSDEFFRVVEQQADCFIMKVSDGWWELYASDATLLRLLEDGPQVSSADSAVWERRRA